MSRSLVMTVLGPDRPGLVEALSSTIAAHDGSWLESRMAQLAGHFTGILRVEVPAKNADALLNALRNLGTSGLTVHAVEETSPTTTRDRCLRFDIMGNDRPGIIKEVAAAIAEAGGNVEELNSDLESAPMAGHPVFHATGTACVAANFDEQSLVTALENLGPDLSVSVTP
jgi:glycine cleavage system regulatory protein